MLFGHLVTIVVYRMLINFLHNQYDAHIYKFHPHTSPPPQMILNVDMYRLADSW